MPDLTCRQRFPAGAYSQYCGACIEQLRESLRCADCASIVTVIIAGECWLDLRHDASCPQWRARRPADGGDILSRTTVEELLADDGRSA